jgi:hypothetical protein
MSGMLPWHEQLSSGSSVMIAAMQQTSATGSWQQLQLIGHNAIQQGKHL